MEIAAESRGIAPRVAPDMRRDMAGDMTCVWARAMYASSVTSYVRRPPLRAGPVARRVPTGSR